MNPEGLISIVAFTILTLLWGGFIYALLFNRPLLEQAWRIFRGGNLLVQGFVVLFALPLVLALWIWQSRWPTWLRLVLVIGLVWFTEYTFFPAAVTAVQVASVSLLVR